MCGLVKFWINTPSLDSLTLDFILFYMIINIAYDDTMFRLVVFCVIVTKV